MTKKEFSTRKWGAGMVVQYKGLNTILTSKVLSVDFEACEIGLEMPLSKDLVFFPCEKCEIIKDFVQK